MGGGGGGGGGWMDIPNYYCIFWPKHVDVQCTLLMFSHDCFIFISCVCACVRVCVACVLLVCCL